MQNWIKSPSFDISFILGPPFVALLCLFLFPSAWLWTSQMPIWAWVILVMCIDVAHVYASLYRTYFDAHIRRKYPLMLYGLPSLIFSLAYLLFYLSPLLFWRAAAYLAVFHFIRQQYGFLKIYSRHESLSEWDTTIIYAACLFPMLIWHFSSNRNFNWFTNNDFIFMPNPQIIIYLKVLYSLFLVVYYGVKVWQFYIGAEKFNIPKNMLIISTVFTWYFGIVYLNGDMAFTMLNVVAHGLPYIALVYAAESKKESNKSAFRALVFSKTGIWIFVGSLLVFAFVEESLWHSLVWHDKLNFFKFMPPVQINNRNVLSMVVAILSVPQFTHYILDGFIWKRTFK